MPPFPDQLLEGGISVHFGQSIEEVESNLGIRAEDISLRISRPGIDQKACGKNVILEFDSGLLNSIEFRRGFPFATSPEPYPDKRKNFCCIEDRRIRAGMTRSEFVDYVTAWEVYACEQGAEKVESPDLQRGEFRFSFDKDRFFDMFHLSMGLSRRAGRGGIWSDSWTAFFEVRNGVASLKSLTAFCDEFNTVARRKD